LRQRVLLLNCRFSLPSTESGGADTVFSRVLLIFPRTFYLLSLRGVYKEEPGHLHYVAGRLGRTGQVR
jgi:hypothetical protein